VVDIQGALALLSHDSRDWSRPDRCILLVKRKPASRVPLLSEDIANTTP